MAKHYVRKKNMHPRKYWMQIAEQKLQINTQI